VIEYVAGSRGFYQKITLEKQMVQKVEKRIVEEEKVQMLIGKSW
jgi:hypothetical protein